MIVTVLRHVVLLMLIMLLGVVESGVVHAILHTDDPLEVTGVPGALAPVLAGLPDRITTAVAEDRLVSVSMAIVVDRDIIFSRAFGYADLEEQLPATPGTIYPMGSITKVFTATMLARLLEQGIVSLEDPVQKYLPDYRPSSPFAGTLPTTLRQLAAHTSGLPQDAPVNFWCNFAGFSWLVTSGLTPMTWFVDCDSLLASLRDLELVYPPEVYAHYSNLNMQLLGLALERACGEPFVTYVENVILAPLGMKDTGFTLDPEQRKRLATGYVCTGPTVPPLRAPEYQLGCAVYSGGLFTTAEDLARFVSSQFQEDEPEGVRILEAETLRRMRTPQSIHRPGIHPSYGIGWGVVQIGGYDAIEHNGALLGYHAHVSAVPDLRLGIVALSNTKNFLWRPDACKELARAILADLADALVGASEGDKFDPATVNLSSFEGQYALPGDVAHLEVVATEGGLSVTLTEVPDFSEKFALVAPNTFCFVSDPIRQPMLFFGENPDGKIASVMFLAHTFRRSAPGR